MNGRLEMARKEGQGRNGRRNDKFSSTKRTGALGAPRRRRLSRASRGTLLGRTQVFPPQKSLQILCREDRCNPLPGCTAIAAIRSRAWQNCSAAADRRLHEASALARTGHQTGTKHRASAVCRALLELRDSIRRPGLRLGHLDPGHADLGHADLGHAGPRTFGSDLNSPGDASPIYPEPRVPGRSPGESGEMKEATWKSF